MKLSGHETEAVYRRYAIADSVALEEGVQRLAALGNGTVTAQSRDNRGIVRPAERRVGNA